MRSAALSALCGTVCAIDPVPIFLATGPAAYSTNFQDRARVLQEWTPQEVHVRLGIKTAELYAEVQP